MLKSQIADSPIDTDCFGKTIPERSMGCKYSCFAVKLEMSLKS